MYSKLEKLSKTYYPICEDVELINNNYFINNEYKNLEYSEFEKLQDRISKLSMSLNFQKDDDMEYLILLNNEYQRIIKNYFDLSWSREDWTNNYDKSNYESKINVIERLFRESKIYEHCPEKYESFLSELNSNIDNLITIAGTLESLLKSESVKANNIFNRVKKISRLVDNMSNYMTTRYINMKNNYFLYCTQVYKNSKIPGLNYKKYEFPDWWNEYLKTGNVMVGADLVLSSDGESSIFTGEQSIFTGKQ